MDMGLYSYINEPDREVEVREYNTDVDYEQKAVSEIKEDLDSSTTR